MAKKSQTSVFVNLKNTFLTCSSLLLSGLILGGCIYFYLAWRLPDVAQLKDAHFQVPLRIYTSDGKLIGEYGEKKRIPISLNQVPKQLITAILDTEDQRFFEHPGVDPLSLMRAAKTVFSTGKKSQGASTITMQVARNFFLTNNKTYARKINEIMLALKIDQQLSKKEILELYINRIYLGQRAYGVAVAAQVYYGKDLNQLSLAELAMIAGLPQAPSRDNPIVNPQAALERRNHVLERMYNNRHIDYKTYQMAINEPLTASHHERSVEVQAPHLAEMVRSAMVRQFGPEVYDQGYSVYTTLDSRLQDFANRALQHGVLTYDKRHGYRGAEQRLADIVPNNLFEWKQDLLNIPVVNQLLPAAVIKIEPQAITALLGDGTTVVITWPGLRWARLADAAEPNQASDIVRLGDVIRVQKNLVNNRWELAQLPKVDAALVTLSPQNGAILALTGGFSYGRSYFNRATQALRQTGSAFKPFIYSAALEKGFTLASVVNDAPVVFTDPNTNILWRPQNDTQNFYGPTRLRIGLMRSQNLVSIRLLRAIGVNYAIDYLQRFGFTPNQLPYGLSLALGTASMSPVQLAAGYATFANGGYRITPYFINMIKDQGGKVLFQAAPPIVPNVPRAISPQNAYLITDALKGVIRGGTASTAKNLHRMDLAGKTGTTNNKNDAWFCGFNGDLVAAVWLGFDQPASIYEYGAAAALPIWISFMSEALQGVSEHSMPQPENIVTARIDPKTGLLAQPSQKNAIFEIFTSETAPRQFVKRSSNYENLESTKGRNVVDASTSETEDEVPLF